MTSRDFCYWFQGFLEIAKPDKLNEAELSKVKQHLAMVFKTEIDPSHGPKPVQDALSHLHSGPLTGSQDVLVLRC